MKKNWLISLLVIVLAAATAIGWFMYFSQRAQYRTLIAQQPTPASSTTLYGVFIKASGNTIEVNIPSADDPQTLVNRTLTIAVGASILRRDATSNEYRDAQLSDLRKDTWVQLGTDTSGIVISITAGQ